MSFPVWPWMKSSPHSPWMTAAPPMKFETYTVAK
jgi:hypothetical protein